MRAQILTAARRPLAAAELPAPRPGPQQVMISVQACAVCRTDLHVVDGELADPKLPLVPGHEIIGTVVEKGEAADRFAIGDRVGVPWLGWTCGICDYCRSGQENLCDRARHVGEHAIEAKTGAWEVRHPVVLDDQAEQETEQKDLQLVHADSPVTAKVR